MIKLALNLYGMATLGCSKVASTLQVIFGDMCERTPHHTTVRNWVIRNGCYNLKKPIEKSNDMVGIGDVTIALGKMKCLAILGVQMSKLEQRADYTLTHEDVVILGLHLTEKSTGEFAHNSFEETRNRIGSDFLGVVIDQGSDIKKGGRLFQELHPNTVVIHDIAHKMSLVMEHELKDDVVWAEFTKKLLETRRLIQQTEFAAMMPPNQRSKARFMDIDYIIDWPGRVIESKRCGRLDIIPEDRYQKYVGWIKDFELPLSDWKFMAGALNMIKGVCREHGLSHGTFEYLKLFFEEASSLIDDERLKKFLGKALKAIEEECCKLSEGQVILGSTEVLESIFGKYKELNSSSQGINSNILGLATFVGPKLTEKTVKEAMEGCSTKIGIGWIKQKVVNTLGSLRHQFFRGKIKGTKFDNKLSVQ
jgi:hypothetical protein